MSSFRLSFDCLTIDHASGLERTVCYAVCTIESGVLRLNMLTTYVWHDVMGHVVDAIDDVAWRHAVMPAVPEASPEAILRCSGCFVALKRECQL
jgi:hypothetical protein